MAGFTETLTHPTRCQNANTLVNVARKAFKAAAAHVGHVRYRTGSDKQRPQIPAFHTILMFAPANSHEQLQQQPPVCSTSAEESHLRATPATQNGRVLVEHPRQPCISVHHVFYGNLGQTQARSITAELQRGIHPIQKVKYLSG